MPESYLFMPTQQHRHLEPISLHEHDIVIYIHNFKRAIGASAVPLMEIALELVAEVTISAGQQLKLTHAVTHTPDP